MILRLDPPIWMATPLGDGQAHFLVHTGPGQHNTWIVAIDATGEWWEFANPEVRRNTSLTDGYTRLSPFSADVLARFHWGPHGKTPPP